MAKKKRWSKKDRKMLKRMIYSILDNDIAPYRGPRGVPGPPGPQGAAGRDAPGAVTGNVHYDTLEEFEQAQNRRDTRPAGLIPPGKRP